MLGDRKTVILRGGAPWGFRLSGGGQSPVYIAKVRSRSKAAYGGLAAGDTLISVNGISTLQQSLREINDIIDTIRDQLIIEVQSTTNPRSFRLDSTSSIDTRESSPVRPLSRLTTPQPKQMDYYQYASTCATPTHPSYSSTPGTNYFDNTNSVNRDQRYSSTSSRSTLNHLPPIFRTATITTNSPQTPIATARVQQSSYRPSISNRTYDTPRSYNGTRTSGYISDTNDFCRSSISVRPMNGTTNVRHVVNQQPHLTSMTAANNLKPSSGIEQNYYSDSEYVTSGPRYYKITRLVNTSRRPSNVVLPIRSVTSKAYDQYVPMEPPKPQQQPFDVYRQQLEQQQQREREQREREQREREQREREQREREQREREQREREHREREQRERERQEQLQRQLYLQQQANAARFNPLPRVTSPTEPMMNREIGAELLISPDANKKRYADSSFFQTSYNTYPTIEEQKKMAHKIATILESGDPLQKGSSKFEKQRQRADKYTIESDATNYRPLRPLQTENSAYPYQHQQQPPQQLYYNSSDIPDCIKHSLAEAQYINPLRYVGAPEEFKQIHMQEHVTHTNIAPQTAMSLVADLNESRGKGAALFQKRKARSEKWVIDENNVKKQGYLPSTNYMGPTAKPWGQRAPSWSDSEGPSFSPIRTTTNPSPVSILPEPILSPTPAQNGPRFGDFNAKPKGFGTWNTDNSSSRGGLETRKPLNLNIEPSIREGIAESHTRSASQPWSPPYNPQSIFPPNQSQTLNNNNNHFNYPIENPLSKLKTPDYSSWNPTKLPEQYNGFNQRSNNNNNTSPNPYPSSQRTQQTNFTDL